MFLDADSVPPSDGAKSNCQHGGLAKRAAERGREGTGPRPGGSHSHCCFSCCYSREASQSLLFPGTVMKYLRLGTLLFVTGSHVVKFKM